MAKALTGRFVIDGHLRKLTDQEEQALIWWFVQGGHKYFYEKTGVAKLTQFTCKVCGCPTIQKTSKVHKCETCRKRALSEAAAKRMLNKGRKRWTVRLAGEDYRVDSNLETAALLVLLTDLKATNIRRSTLMLKYEYKGQRTFNPDFLCTIQGRPTVVEVKMPHSSTSRSHYNQTMPAKRMALQAYAEAEKLDWLWLDYKSAPKLLA